MNHRAVRRDGGHELGELGRGGREEVAVFPLCFVMIIEKGFPGCVRGRQHSKTGNRLGTQREVFCLRCMWPDLFCSEVSKAHDTCKRISVDLSCDKKNKTIKLGFGSAGTVEGKGTKDERRANLPAGRIPMCC